MESGINSDGNIRELIIQRLFKSTTINMSPSKKINVTTKRILLIDEVDVFFSKNLSDDSYNPIAEFISDETVAILTYIFTYRMNSITLNQIKALPEYTSLINKCYTEVIPLINEQMNKMLVDVNTFHDPPYEFVALDGIGKSIWYNTSDCSDTKINYEYLYEATRDADICAIANEQLALQRPCGSYSLAHIPIDYFQGILGAIGVFRLSLTENELLKNDFKTVKITIAPSMYGDSKLVFREDSDVILAEDKERYHQTILKDIQEERIKGRPVLVFFKTEKELRQLERSDYGKRIDDMNVVTEKTSNVAFYVNKATSLGTATLFPKLFGRGLDFVCRDIAVDAAGGVHVIKTFFSGYTSEDIQIKGRTVRHAKFSWRIKTTDFPINRSASRRPKIRLNSTQFIARLLNPKTSLSDIVKAIQFDPPPKPLP
eukprot:gene5337-10675_t